MNQVAQWSKFKRILSSKISQSIFPRLEQRQNSRFADKETESTIRNLTETCRFPFPLLSSPVGTLPIKSNRGIQLKLDPVFTEVQQDACSMRTNIETSKADIASRRLNSRAKRHWERKLDQGPSLSVIRYVWKIFYPWTS